MKNGRSLQLELTHLQANVASVSSSKYDIMTTLAAKLVTVPAVATLYNISVSDTGRTDRQYAQLVMKKAEWTETKNYTVPSPYITFN